MKYQNIYRLFREQTAKHRGKPVFYSRKDDNWVSQNWEEFEEQVHDFACALLAKGLTKGASVAILAGNVPEWTIVDIATIAAGGVGVGIYPTSSAEQCEYIIDHSDAEFVVVDSLIQLEKLSEIDISKVKEIICLEAEARTLVRAENSESEKSFSALADARASACRMIKMFVKITHVFVRQNIRRFEIARRKNSA